MERRFAGRRYATTNGARQLAGTSASCGAEDGLDGAGERTVSWTFRSLKPQEVELVWRAFDELEHDEWTRQVRVMFLLLVTTGLRRGEALGLRWKDLQLGVPGEATLMVRETWVCGAPDTPKSEAGERTLTLAEFVADELFQHRARSAFNGDKNRVFCHPQTG